MTNNWGVNHSKRFRLQRQKMVPWPILLSLSFCLVHGLPAAEEKSSVSEDIIVLTPLGQLRGQILTSRGGHRYAAFVGIPFAEKTARFEVARPVQPWEGVRDALNYSSACPQLSSTSGVDVVIGDEDCLYINVYYPTMERCLEENNQTQLAVMFFIYGGKFTIGRSDVYGPAFIMDECVTLVTFNYRIGALGFLTTNDGVIPGNLGLKDQLLALKWTRDNIEIFRGNKDLVTIVGQSAGAMSVGHMIISPATKGLFTRAIAQSGSVENAYALIRNPTEKAAVLGQLLNCTANPSSNELKGCLLALPFADIVRYQDEGKAWFKDPKSWGPVMENVDAVDPYQTRNPHEILRSGEFTHVPLLTGIMLDEGILAKAGVIMQNPAAVNDLNTNWNKYAPLTFNYNDLNLTQVQLTENSDQIHQFFFANKSISNETFEDLVHLYSDRSFGYGMFRQVELHSKFAPVYHYVFTFKGSFSFAMPALGYTQPVVTHSDENQYLFEFSSVPTHQGDDLTLSQNFVKLWTSFVKYGEPLGTWTNGVKWSPYIGTDDNGRVTMKLDTIMEPLTDYIGDRRRFWDDLQLTQVEFPNKRK